MTTLSEMKSQATILKNYLKQNNATITHSACLHAVAKMHGYKDWNVMSAYLSKQESNDFLNLNSNVIQGALYSILQATCGIESNPENFTVKTNQAGEIIGFALKGLKADNLSEAEIDGKLKFDTLDYSKRQFNLGIHLGSEIEKILSHYAFEDFSGTTLRGRTPRYSKIDMVGLIKESENTSASKMRSSLKFEADIKPEQHPKLIELKKFIEEADRVNNVKEFLILIRESLDQYYHIGWGGDHIHFKKLGDSNGNIIAIISRSEVRN